MEENIEQKKPSKKYIIAAIILIVVGALVIIFGWVAPEITAATQKIFYHVNVESVPGQKTYNIVIIDRYSQMEDLESVTVVMKHHMGGEMRKTTTDIDKNISSGMNVYHCSIILTGSDWVMGGDVIYLDAAGNSERYGIYNTDRPSWTVASEAAGTVVGALIMLAGIIVLIVRKAKLIDLMPEESEIAEIAENFKNIQNEITETPKYEERTCEYCGTINRRGATRCEGCGARFTKIK